MSNKKISSAGAYSIYKPGLDGLRFVFASMVVAQHYYNYRVKDLGGYGVVGFLALSGFLITSLLIAEEKKCGMIDLPAFYVRRLLRIWPIYFIVIALTVLVRGYPSNELHYLWNDLTFSRALLGRDILQGKTGYLWSISVEEIFYLSWPPLFLLCRKHYVRLILLVLMIGYLAFINDYVFNRFIPIMIGCLASLIVEAGGQNDARRTGGALKYAGIVLFVSLLSTPLVYSVPSGVVCSILVLAFSGPALSSNHGRFFPALGKFTYSMYLFHPLCKDLIQSVFNKLHIDLRLFGFVVTWSISILIASISWRILERPFLLLKPKLEFDSISRFMAVTLSYGIVTAGIVLQIWRYMV